MQNHKKCVCFHSCRVCCCCCCCCCWVCVFAYLCVFVCVFAVAVGLWLFLLLLLWIHRLMLRFSVWLLIDPHVDSCLQESKSLPLTNLLLFVSAPITPCPGLSFLMELRRTWPNKHLATSAPTKPLISEVIVAITSWEPPRLRYSKITQILITLGPHTAVKNAPNPLFVQSLSRRCFQGCSQEGPKLSEIRPQSKSDCFRKQSCFKFGRIFSIFGPPWLQVCNPGNNRQHASWTNLGLGCFRAFATQTQTMVWVSLPKNADHGLSFSFPWWIQSLGWYEFGLRLAWAMAAWVRSGEVRTLGWV